MDTTLYAAGCAATPRPWKVEEVDVATTGLVGHDGSRVFNTDRWLSDMDYAAHCISRFEHIVGALERRLADCYHDPYCAKHLRESYDCTCTVGTDRILLRDALRVKSSCYHDEQHEGGALPVNRKKLQ